MEINHIKLKRFRNDNSVPVPNKKQSQTLKKNKALSQIDNAKFGWFHVRVILVSGIGFFTVKYN
jgi:PHS family inorganic phosphate transporter-like MFS transporter